MRKRPKKKNKAAVELGRLGGLKGGYARAASMTAKERSDAARYAATIRWSNQKEVNDEDFQGQKARHRN